jgi:protein-L-isoaspartate(D-aspartate) O-methyltransferase
MFGGLFGGAPRTTQAQLVQHLVAQHLLRTPRVIDAFRHVDRRGFVNENLLASPDVEAYEDRPLPIGSGQTISAPHMHAMCAEALADKLVPGARVLDVGSGSGYLVSVFAKLVGEGGYVLGVEKEPDLAARSLYSLSRANPELFFSTGRDSSGDGGAPGSPRSPRRNQPALGQQEAAAAADAVSPTAAGGPHHSGGVRVVHGNVLDPEGPLKGEALFDAIHVGAAADELHSALVAALKPGGRMVVPVGPRYGTQELTVVDKDAESGRVSTRRVTAVSYVPLTKPGEADDGLTAAEARRFARLVRAQEREDEMAGAEGGAVGAETVQEEQERRRRHEHGRHHHHQHQHRRDEEEM